MRSLFRVGTGVLCLLLFFGIHRYVNSLNVVAQNLPNLVLVLNAPELPEFRLPLENKALFVDVNTHVLGVSNQLYMPVKSTNTPVTLRLSVRNSPEDSKTTAEGFSVWVAYSDNLECSFGSGWSRGVRAGFLGYRYIAYKDDVFQIHPDWTKELTDIAFTPRVGGWNGWIPTGTGVGQNSSSFVILLAVETKGAPRKVVALELVCPVLPSMSAVEPKLLLKNTGAFLNFVWTNAP